MGTMGERFLLFRLPEVDSSEQARRALDHAGRESEMRAELAQTVATLFGLPVCELLPRTSDDDKRLISLATLVVRARSVVERDGYSREIELIPSSEAPTRLVVVLARLLAGLDAIGVGRVTAWPVVTKAALDSIPRFAGRPWTCSAAPAVNSRLRPSPLRLTTRQIRRGARSRT
jgi:hypothetical protein